MLRCATVSSALLKTSFSLDILRTFTDLRQIILGSSIWRGDSSKPRSFISSFFLFSIFSCSRLSFSSHHQRPNRFVFFTGDTHSDMDYQPFILPPLSFFHLSAHTTHTHFCNLVNKLGRHPGPGGRHVHMNVFSRWQSGIVPPVIRPSSFPWL